MKANYIENYEQWASEFTYAVPLKVRFSDIDMYGIANNAVIISYLEYARIEFFKHMQLMKDWVKPDCQTVPVVADIQCDYVQPIYYDEDLSIYVKVDKIGNSSIDIHYLAKNAKEEVVFTGRTSLVQIHKSSGKGHPWTNEERHLFKEA